MFTNNDKRKVITTSLNSKLLGRPGLINNLTIVGVSPKNPTGDPMPKVTNKRFFDVKCALFSSVPLWDSNLIIGSLPVGTTLLKISSNIKSYTLETSNGSFEIHMNDKGYLGSISAQVEATNWGVAVENFNSLVNPYLSKLSWSYDVPLAFSNLAIYDKENDLQHIKFIQAFEEKNLQLDIGFEEALTSKIQALYSFYRETLNSNSASYRFLCIYKSLQIANLMKKELEGLIKNSPEKLREFAFQTEVKVEKNEVNNSVWPECVGFKLNRLIDEKIRPMRNKVAHEFIEKDIDFSNPDTGIFKEQLRDYGDALILLLKKQIRLFEEYYKKSLS